MKKQLLLINELSSNMQSTPDNGADLAGQFELHRKAVTAVNKRMDGVLELLEFSLLQISDGISYRDKWLGRLPTVSSAKPGSNNASEQRMSAADASEHREKMQKGAMEVRLLRSQRSCTQEALTSASLCKPLTSI